MRNKIIDFVTSRIKLCLTLIICFLFPLIYCLKDVEQDFGAKIWYSKSNKMIKTLEQFERTYGNDENIGLAFYKESGIFDRNSLAFLEEATKQTWLIKDVVRVDSIANYSITKADGDDIVVNSLYSDAKNLSDTQILEIEKSALADKVAPYYLISPDKKLALIIAKLKPSFSNSLDNKLIVESANEAVKTLEKLMPKSSELFIFGTAAVTDAYREVSYEDIKLTMPLLLICIIGFLFYTFRSIEGIILPLVIIVISILSTFGILGMTGMKFNNLTATIPGILTAICIADTVHILATMYIGLSSGKNLKEAIKYSLVKNLGPTLFTTLSTAIGFATLLTSDIVPIHDLGILATIGTMIAWFLTIFFIPSIMLALPSRFFIPKEGFKEKKSKYLTLERCESYVHFIFRHKIKIVTIFSVSSLIALALSFKNTVNSNPLNYFSSHVKIKRDYDLIKKHMHGINGPQIVIHSGIPDGVKKVGFLKKVEAYDYWIKENIEGVAVSVSGLDIIKKMNQVFYGGDEKFYQISDADDKISQFFFLYSMSLPQGLGLDDRISSDFENMRLNIVWQNHNSAVATKNIDRINDAAKNFGLNAYVSGQMPLYQKLNGYVVDTFFKSMGLGIILVGLFMIFIFKSVKMGLLSMLPNIIPLTYGGAIMYLSGNDIDLGAAINYTVCLGVIVDDTIHFLFDYNKHRKNGVTVEQSLINVLYYTGPALILTTVILTVGFGIFLVSSFVPNINFGVFCAVIFSMALLVDLVFLPALLLLKTKELK